MAATNLAEATSAVFGILEPLAPQDRKRVISATLALLADEPSFVDEPKRASSSTRAESDREDSEDIGLNPRTTKWLRQNGITTEELQEVFHFSGGKVEVIASRLPANSRREQTGQAYLLEGFRAFLETGEPKFTDEAAMQLTKRFGAFDTNNHSGNRKSLGNSLSGSRQAGFELSQPGLRTAVALVKQLAALDGKERAPSE
jgi:hypothetical protein